MSPPPGHRSDSSEAARWVAGLEVAAREALPAPVATYFGAGAGEGATAAQAHEAWREVRLLPRVLRGVGEVDASVTLFGETYAAPIGIAPTAMQRAAHPDGELAMVRAASAARLPVCVPLLAGHRFADIGSVADRWWLQVYVDQQRSRTERAVSAAVEAGAGALVLTADTPVVGTKDVVDDADWERLDISWHGCNLGPDSGPWATDLTWDAVEWLRGLTGLPVVVKGVLRPDDAVAAGEAGADAVWVSNHGGRQLDRTESTARALPGVADAFSGGSRQPPVVTFVDGGIRSGADVLCALGSGAQAAFVGRWALYALAVAGEDGVTALLRELVRSLTEAMRIAGAADLVETTGLITPKQAPEHARTHL